ncbi:tetratricopeptide repeat protein [Streptomyces sp. NPDC004111]|uniref:tetratricopeptide repeat protein n=1 Tax=Streptomyces sp. NPDC004111 TaxID=3364690 RepID=UPI0036C68620
MATELEELADLMEQATHAAHWIEIRLAVREVVYRRHGCDFRQGWLDLCTLGGKDGTSAKRWEPWLAVLDEADPEGTTEMRRLLRGFGLHSLHSAGPIPDLPARGPSCELPAPGPSCDLPPRAPSGEPPAGKDSGGPGEKAGRTAGAGSVTRVGNDMVLARGNIIVSRGPVGGVQLINYGGHDRPRSVLPAPRGWVPAPEASLAEYGVRPARRVPGLPEVLPYVERDCDSELAAQLAGPGLVLVLAEPLSGTSHTAWRAVTRMTGHWICAPDPGTDLRTLPALVEEFQKQGTDTGKCLLWLDGLKGHRGTGGLEPRLLGRLTDLEVTVLATMRTGEYRKSRTDRVVATARTVEVGRQWSAAELSRLKESADADPRLAAAYDRTEGEGVVAHLAFGHLLAEEWQDPETPAAHPRGHLLVRAALDLARCGVRQAVPVRLLRRMHEEAYGVGADELSAETFEEALDWATRDHFRIRGLGMLVHDEEPEAWRVHSALGADPCPPTATEPVWAWLVDRMTEADGVDPAPVRERYCDELLQDATDGDVGAMIRIAELRSRLGALPEALRWYRGAADAGSPEAAARAGELLFEAADFGTDTIGYLEQAARAGHPASAALLSQVHLERARHWFAVAGKTGDNGAAFRPALQILGVRSATEGVRQLSRAADEGDQDAARTLAELRSALTDARPVPPAAEM